MLCSRMSESKDDLISQSRKKNPDIVGKFIEMDENKGSNFVRKLSQIFFFRTLRTCDIANKTKTTENTGKLNSRLPMCLSAYPT